ncbi:cytochrome b5-related protein-like [Ctenocephalides felis]|uniref:cytochrome b5-related protein-like n=1 Tax=Ctenocephalides felis TaxID=7515 RepID=UPI000E6E345A|nr:cytochrome b5-related protein-like [Ctenocephalides felis]
MDTENKGECNTHTHYPSLRDVLPRSTDRWILGQRLDGGAEGLWRIHNKLYDLTKFVENHPGGKEWLEMTQNTDITAAFEAHHISLAAEKLLPKFYVRDAQTPSHSLLTYHENGFYRTLKRRVREEIKNIPKIAKKKSKLILDCFILGTFISSMLATAYCPFIFVAALFLTWTTIAAHNFFHQRNNWRMYAFNLSMMNHREWRISHALSHHLHPNTLVDMELSIAEPFLSWQSKEKSILRYISWTVSPVFYASLYITQYLSRVLDAIERSRLHTPLWQEVIPFSLPLAMLLTSSLPVISTLKIWLMIVVIASFFFGVTAFNAAHHHPEIYHHGDTPREDLDFGKFQIDTVMERQEVTGSLFLVLTTFGDHGLHHLFPTLDHAELPYLYPVFRQVCKEFGMNLRFTSQWDLFKGQFRQLLKTVPNMIAPDKVRK